MITCSHCGKANNPQASFCELCGNSLQSPEVADSYTMRKPHEQISYQEIATAMPADEYVPSVYNATPASEGWDPYSNSNNRESPYQQVAVSYTPYESASRYSMPAAKAQGRTVGSIIFGIVLYLIGLSSASVGAAGFSMVFSDNDNVTGVAFFGVGLVGLIALVVITILHKKPLLKWWVRLLIVVGLIVVGFIILIITAAISDAAPNPDKALDLYLGGNLLVFGALIAIFAVL